MTGNNIRKSICIVAAACGTTALAAQYKPHPVSLTDFGFTSPVNIPVLLSANYGELRGAHFHGGIDVKTQGVINKPVLAVAEGYVARIAVSPSGFGKALYMNHPNGTTTVYGHLERFDERIEQYIHEEQYARKSFTVDIEPPRDMFVYRQGDRIALSGNRGSSGGPHLHFEVRETASQRPLNVLARGALFVTDSIPPRPKMLYYIGIDTVQGIPVHTVRHKLSVKRAASGGYSLSDTMPLRVSGTGYFAVEAEEKKNGTDNPMGIYTIDASRDGQPFFSMNVDRIPFDLGRYAYAAALYPQSRSTRNGVYRLCVLPNNPLPVYGKEAGRGILTVPDDGVHEIEITLTDDCSNSSTLAFFVRRGLPAPEPKTGGIPVRWKEEYRYAGEGMSLSVPSGTLYESILLELGTKPRQSYSYSPLYAIHAPDVPVQKGMTVSLDASGLPERLRSKALLGTVNGSGSRSPAGGAWKEGKVTVSTRSFGTYYIAVDTVPPRITPSFKNGEDYSARKTIALTIGDDFSGVGSYTGTIDGHWALFEYDAKSGRLTHYFDDVRWEKGRTHELVLSVSDNKGNRTTFKGNYKR